MGRREDRRRFWTEIAPGRSSEAAAFNGRPREASGWRTPAEAFDEALRAAHTGGAATG